MTRCFSGARKSMALIFEFECFDHIPLCLGCSI
jgi:hypothetical protein